MRSQNLRDRGLAVNKCQYAPDKGDAPASPFLCFLNRHFVRRYRSCGLCVLVIIWRCDDCVYAMFGYWQDRFPVNVCFGPNFDQWCLCHFLITNQTVANVPRAVDSWTKLYVRERPLLSDPEIPSSGDKWRKSVRPCGRAWQLGWGTSEIPLETSVRCPAD